MASWWVTGSLLLFGGVLFSDGESLAKTLFGSVKEDPQILAIDLQLAADVVFVPFLEKQPSDEVPVPLRQSVNRLPHLAALLGLQDLPFNAWLGGLGLRHLVVQCRRSPARA